MDFSERFSQALQATLGMEMHGHFGEPGLVRFSPSTVTFGTEELEYRDGVYSFYQYERASRGGASFKSSSLHVMEHCLTLHFGKRFRIWSDYKLLTLDECSVPRVGWSLVPVGDGRQPGYLGIRSESGVFYSCKTYQSWLLSCLSFVVEYSPLDVLECYLRPDGGPLLSQWVDREWTPEEDE